MIVTICISTFKRPEGLVKLLQSLDRLTFAEAAPQVEIVVADNECSASTRQLVEKQAVTSPWIMHYAAESQRGISYARNRSVNAANRNSDWLAFIDDDSWCEPDWLDRLLQTAQRYNADAVMGRVVPEYTENTPQWVKDGGFFEEEVHSTGTRWHTGATNNCLVKASHAFATSTPFQTRFALTGGEDAYFFMNLHRHGGTIVWCAEAVVHEDIPDSRATAAWICKRGKRCWASHSMIERELQPGVDVKVMRALKGGALIAIGAVRLPVAIFKGQAHKVHAMRTIYRGIGTLQGLTGAMDAEYQVVHTGKATVKV